MFVNSPKTKRHEGHESRWVPLFPKLLPYLEVCFELAEPGQDFVIQNQPASGNVRTGLTRLVKRAGLTPWPRITNNLRASRESELCNEFPAHVVSKWLGNSVDVATKHYLQVTDKLFEKALQNPVQIGAESARIES